MAWVRNLRGRSYQVLWKFEGRERSRAGFPTKRDAEAFRVEVEGLLARGLDWRPPEPAVVDALPTLEEAVMAYLAYVETVKAPSTTYQRALSFKLFERFVADVSPTTTLKTLSRSTLEAFLRWLLDPSSSVRGGRAADHARKCVEHVQLAWAWWYDHDDWGKLVPPPRKLRDLPRAPRTPTKAPTWAEMDAVIAQLGSPDVESRGRLQRDVTYHVLVAAIERCTGLRVSQVERLRVGDVDHADAVLTFRGELGKSHAERAGRLIPLAPPLMPVLRALCEGRAADETLVPARGDVARQNRRERVKEAWKKTEAAAQIFGGRPNHAFRKGFVSGLARAGVDREVRQFLVSQSTGLSGIYTDPESLPLRDAVAKVPAFHAEAAEVVMRAATTRNATPADAGESNGSGTDQRKEVEKKTGARKRRSP